MSSLGVKALLGLVALALIEGLLLFLAAGSVHYWQAWVYLGIFFGIAVATTLYLMKNDPALLKRRLSGGPLAERQATQQLIMFLAAIGFVGLLAVSSFDHRFRWSSVPNFVVIIGDLLIALGFFIIFLVYKENSFTSATIEVSSGQSVISTGPYAIVRHPMYAGSLLYFAGTPLSLASYWGLIALLVVLPAVTWRLLDEERFLAQSLPGYAAYRDKVRWRLIPGVF